MLVDGKKIAQQIYDRLERRIQGLSFQPVFVDVVIGDDPVSLQYVSVKEKAAQKVGIKFIKLVIPGTEDSEKVQSKMREMLEIEGLSGMIVQLPLPFGFDTQEILRVIPEKFDVDVVGPGLSGKFFLGEKTLIPPTAAAIMHIFENLKIELMSKSIVVVGKGGLVGRPITFLLKQRGLGVSVIDSKTENPAKLLLGADIIISGVGKPKLITGDMVKQGAVVVDAGTSESMGSVVGDVDTMSVLPKASYLVAVPGGVGPITVAKLIENVVTVAEGSGKA